MSIELSGSVEEQLRDLAARQGRDVAALVEDEEAVRQYLEAAAITDVEPSDAASAQEALLAELPDVRALKADEAGHVEKSGGQSFRRQSVAAPALARETVDIQTGGGKHPLPQPLPPGVRILARQRVRKPDPASPLVQIVLMLSSHALQMAPKVLRYARRGEAWDVVASWRV